MPVYRFIVQGEGIRTESDSIGFFATRSAKADDEAAAREAVLAAIAADWRSGESAGLSPGLPPALTVVQSWVVTGGIADRRRATASMATTNPPKLPSKSSETSHRRLRVRR